MLHGLPNLIIVAQPLYPNFWMTLAGLPSTLSHRRNESRLSMFGKTVAISLDNFSKSTNFTRFSDASTFTTISARTDPYKYSFFPRTICAPDPAAGAYIAPPDPLAGWFFTSKGK